MTVLALKLLLTPGSIGVASMVARRFGRACPFFVVPRRLLAQVGIVEAVARRDLDVPRGQAPSPALVRREQPQQAI